MLKRFVFIAVSALSLAASSQAAFFQAAINGNAAITGFGVLKIGGGGYATGLSFNADGTNVAVPNTATAYLWNGGSSSWQPLITSANLPTTVWPYLSNFGSVPIELQVAPSNSSVMYAMIGYGNGAGGAWIVSTNKGTTWADISGGTTGLAYNSNMFNTNFPNSQTNHPMLAIDPNNSDFVITGTTGTGAAFGAYYTLNGSAGSGTTWTKISGIAASPSGGYYLFAFDATSAHTCGAGSNQTCTVWAFSQGSQPYRSTTGIAGTFSQVTTGAPPTTFYQWTVDQGGNVWASTGAAIWKYGGSSWSSLLTCSCGVPDINPANVNQVVVIGYDGNAFWATDGVIFNGGNNCWTCSGWTVSAADVPWLQTPQISTSLNTDMSLGGFSLFDTSVSNCVSNSNCPLYIGGGTGVYHFIPKWPVAVTITNGNPSIAGTNSYAVGDSVSFTTSPATGFGTFTPYYVISTGLSTTHFELSATSGGTAITPGSAGSGTAFLNPVWISQTAGQETLDCTSIVQPPGGTSVVEACWDRSVFYKSNPESGYATSQNWDAANGPPVVGWMLDYAYGSPSTMVVMNANQGGGGTDDSAVSTDGGQTWTKFTNVPGSTTGFASCIAVLTANNAIWVGGSSVGPYYTSNLGGSATWTQSTFSGTTPVGGFGGQGQKACAADRVTPSIVYLYVYSASSHPGVYKSTDSGHTFTQVFNGSLGGTSQNAILKAFPSDAGWLLWSGTMGSDNLKKSTDGGATWNNVTTGGNAFTNVQSFGFGAPFSGQTHSSIYVYGQVTSVSNSAGLYQSQDGGATWTLLANYPGGIYINIVDIDGDKTTPGYYYYTTPGQGSAYYGRLNFLLKRDIDPASNDNSPMYLPKAA